LIVPWAVYLSAFPPPKRPQRTSREEPADPSPLELAANFIKAMSKWTLALFPIVSEAQYRQRMSVCAACDFWNADARGGLGKCSHPKCGCSKFKGWLATEMCPINKWPKLE
jgi:hypothetical protein